jgi:hypothetical protein
MNGIQTLSKLISLFSLIMYDLAQRMRTEVPSSLSPQSVGSLENSLISPQPVVSVSLSFGDSSNVAKRFGANARKQGGREDTRRADINV